MLFDIDKNIKNDIYDYIRITNSKYFIIMKFYNFEINAMFRKLFKLHKYPQHWSRFAFVNDINSCLIPSYMY